MAETYRVLLYSHDSQGLGHVRRNLAIAHNLARRLPGAIDADVAGLLVTGLAPASRFPLPEGFDWVTIPGVSKGRDGYRPRSLSGATGDLIKLRSRLLQAALLGFKPDLVIIDRHIYGVWSELREPLMWLREQHPTVRVVLGLREVLDDPRVAAAEWERLGDPDRLRDLVDEVWVYGDPRVHDATSSGEIPPALASRALFTGYLAAGRADVDPHPGRLVRPYVLTTAGGGSDGGPLVEAAAGARVPGGHDHIVVAGPQLDEDRFARAQALAGPSTTVVRSCPGLAHRIREAAAVVAMGGYNTVCEILATSTPALIIPREKPRLEQAIRARALSRASAIDTARQQAATPDLLSQWLAGAVRSRTDRSHVELGGLAAAARAATRLLTRTPEGEPA